MFLKHHRIGSPALDCLSPTTCRPCYPGRFDGPLPFSISMTSAFPTCPLGRHLQIRLTRLRTGSLALRPAALPFGNLRPLIAQTPLPCATGMHGQLPGRDFNPIDKQLLLRTDNFLFLRIFRIFSVLMSSLTAFQASLKIDQGQLSILEVFPHFLLF